LALKRRRDRRHADAFNRLTAALVVDKEKRLVASDWTTGDETELISPEHRFARTDYGCWSEEIARIHDLIAKELEGRSVKRIGSGFCREVDHAAVEPAEFGRGALRFNLEFLNRVNDRRKCHLARLRLQNCDAVEQVFVCARPFAVNAREL